ncbi:hypothetical protein RFI_00651, partial [Reticulomyxa filosa]
LVLLMRAQKTLEKNGQQKTENERSQGLLRMEVPLSKEREDNTNTTGTEERPSNARFPSLPSCNGMQRLNLSLRSLLLAEEDNDEDSSSQCTCDANSGGTSLATVSTDTNHRHARRHWERIVAEPNSSDTSVANAANTSEDDRLALMMRVRKDQALKEAELMNVLLKKVEKFVRNNEHCDMNRFQNRVGNVPTNPAHFSLWVAGKTFLKYCVLQNETLSDITIIIIMLLQLQILTSRNVQERLKLATYLAATCIECAQRRSKVQFWIIVTIIVMALLFEFVNSR